MNRQYHLPTLLIIAVICSISFVILGQFAVHERLATFDRSIIQFVQSFESPFLTAIFRGFSHIGSGYGVTLITLAFCFIAFFFLHEKRKSILFAIAIVSTILFNAWIKTIYERPRPTGLRFMEASGYSFPSGHTMMAVSLYAMIVYLLWRHMKNHRHKVMLICSSFVIAAMIAISRIYVGVHYPTDIMGGILCSTALLAFMFLINELLQHGQFTKKS